MPPKVKTDRDAVVAAAFEVAKRAGVAGITAKSVSAELGTSVAPIFRAFPTLEALRAAVISHIHAFHVEYLQRYPLERSKFFSYGMAYIQFAREYPRLFDALEESGFFTPDAVEQEVSSQLSFVEDSVVSVSNLSAEQARELFYHIWLYTHGIACLVCKGCVALSPEEEKRLLITAFQAFSAHQNR